MCRRTLAAGTLPTTGGDRPQVVVTVPLAVLRDGVGSATLDDGTVISAGAARRLACDAAVIPAVLGGRSEVLDVGRARRLFTGPLRRALVLRDRGCAFPGCDRPASWCEAHHLRPWAAGGGTSLDNGVLLCRHHHRLVETGDWPISLGADGIPEFRPPPWIDPDRDRCATSSTIPGGRGDLRDPTPVHRSPDDRRRTRPESGPRGRSRPPPDTGARTARRGRQDAAAPIRPGRRRPTGPAGTAAGRVGRARGAAADRAGREGWRPGERDGSRARGMAADRTERAPGTMPG
jgi:hypothetical protein